MTPSPLITYRIRFANDADAAAVVDLRIQAERWLHAAGIEQWTVSSTGKRNIMDSIQAGRTYVVTTQVGDVVASLTLDGPDLDFWHPLEAADPALYLYKFMIRDDRRGTGLGEVLLDWCCARAQAVSARYLRLDCWRSNFALHRYYLDRGFRQVGVRSAPGRQSGALFERAATVRTSGPHRFVLVDDTVPASCVGMDRYDPTGEAATWQAAAAVVTAMADQPAPHPEWVAALTQAARVLALRSHEVRQANGMYYRVMDGHRGSEPPLVDIPAARTE